MTKKLLFLLVLLSCGPVMQYAEPAKEGMPMTVEAFKDYSSPRQVPSNFRHLVDWHAGTGPITILFTDSSKYACVISPEEATKVRIGQVYHCKWRIGR